MVKKFSRKLLHSKPNTGTLMLELEDKNHFFLNKQKDIAMLKTEGMWLRNV